MKLGSDMDCLNAQLTDPFHFFWIFSWLFRFPRLLVYFDVEENLQGSAVHFRIMRTLEWFYWIRPRPKRHFVSKSREADASAMLGRRSIAFVPVWLAFGDSIVPSMSLRWIASHRPVVHEFIHFPLKSFWFKGHQHVLW